MGNADKALEDAESCIQVNSSWAKGYARKGAALHKLKRYELCGYRCLERSLGL